MKFAITFSVMLLQLLFLTTSPSFAGGDFEKFFGQYSGTAENDVNNELPGRKMAVTVKPYKQGFNVTWTTTSYRANKKEKKSTFSINFKPGQAPGVYGSAMSKDVFGHEKPLDPLKGDPFVWAHIEGDTLVVNSLLVSENGGYEIQTYERTLIDGGLYLIFSRVQNGKVLRQIKGTLKKIN